MFEEVSTRKLGLKWGFILSLISFAYLSQTSIKGVLGIPLISDYVDFELPVEYNGINFVIIAWVLLAIGLLVFFLAVFDIKPFDY